MKYLAVVLLGISILYSTLVCSMIHVITNVNVYFGDVLEEAAVKDAVIRGDIHYLFLLKEFWKNYPVPPKGPYFSIYFDWTAFLVTGGVLALMIWLMRSRLKASWAVVGLLAVFSSAIPYWMGRIALHNNTSLECGPWLMTMLSGLLYATMAAGVCSALELYSGTKRLQKLT